MKMATFDQYLQFGHMVSADAISCELMQAILEGRVEIIHDRITVPNLSAAGLVALAQSKLHLTYLNPDLADWDFYKNQMKEIVEVGGETYEVMVWAPGCDVSTNDVRNYFPEDFTGNTAAFIAWVTAKNPRGFYVSIPEDDRLIQGGGRPCAPSFCREDRHPSLNLEDIRDGWYGHYRFVAFHKVK